MNAAGVAAPDARRLLRTANWPILLALVGLVLALVVARVPVETRVQTLQVTFDISQSMFVEDAELDGLPLTRLEAARRASRALLRRLPCGSRMGWSVFTGRRVLTLTTPVEVCAHYDALVSSLDNIDGSLRWSNASIIGKGLHQALRAAADIGDDTVVLFFTDGHEAPPLHDGARGMPAVDVENVGGLLVGVGGLTPMRIPRLDDAGAVVGYWAAEDVVQRAGVPESLSREELSALKPEHLESLARLSGLGVHRLERVDALLDALDALGRGRVESIERDVRWLPASLALLALLWRFRPWGTLRRA